jgi:hypothetical protein
MATVTQDPGVASWTPINMFAMLRAMVNNNVPFLTINGTLFPVTNGTSGTYAGQAGPGAGLVDYANGIEYQNTGTLASPVWTRQTIAATGLASNQISPAIVQTITGQISSANIIATTAGALGHVNGVIMVPACAAKSVNVLLSATISMDFLTAAYTAGGNTTVNIGGGGAALTGLVNTTTFIQAASDVIINLVPLAATNNNYVVGANSLNLVTSIAPTNPGTAAGVINYQVTYQTIPALLD